MTGTAIRPGRRQRTLLQALIGERHLTRDQTIVLLDGRAEEMGVDDFALSLRQLDRWFAGGVATLPRPSVCRVIEAEFGHPVERLLAPDRRADTDRADPLTAVSSKMDLRTVEFLTWLVEHSALSFHEVYDAVATATDRLRSEPAAARAARAHARAQVCRARVADALIAYYGSPAGRFYRARVGDSQTVRLSILSDPAWLGVAIPLGSDQETFRLASNVDAPVYLADTCARAALARLASIEVAETVIINNPLYRLLGVDIGRDHLTATVGLTDFAAYVLTADLLEMELLDSITESSDQDLKRRLPLRDLYLPTVESALSFETRICAGGPACLLAIARPDDYLLLIQERSTRVVNVAGKLAVIPKAFHQPMVDHLETRISASLERELEEELLGRKDLEQLSASSNRRAAPRHPLRRTEPMEWLLANTDAYHVECTGFGINMLTGNYEFPCLALIDDERWWSQYGDRVEANWETMRVRCYSSRDAAGLTELIIDSQWSNEGLFAFIEGLRRLSELGNDRVSVPEIEVAI
jgi:hypothetical protein